MRCIRNGTHSSKLAVTSDTNTLRYFIVPGLSLGYLEYPYNHETSQPVIELENMSYIPSNGELARHTFDTSTNAVSNPLHVIH